MSILSIAVPTYNRRDKLERCLQMLCAQIVHEGLENQVEVLVSDNASTDGSVNVLQNFDFPGVKIRRLFQQENLGFDRNVNELYMTCTSDYVWYFADDDILIDGALGKVVNSISQYSPDVMMFSFEQPPNSGFHAFAFEQQVYVTTDPEEQAELLYRFPKISAYVLKKITLSEGVANESAVFIGTNFYFVALCYSLLKASSNSTVAVISEILARSDDDYNIIRFSADTWLGNSAVLKHPFVVDGAQRYARTKERELYYSRIIAIWAAYVGAWLVESKSDYLLAGHQIGIRFWWLLRRPKQAVQLLLIVLAYKRMGGSHFRYRG